MFMAPSRSFGAFAFSLAGLPRLPVSTSKTIARAFHRRPKILKATRPSRALIPSPSRIFRSTSSTTQRLLRLLHRLAADISVDVCSISNLSAQPLHHLPRLSSRRWCALIGNQRVAPSNHLSNSSLNKAALTVPRPQEDGVDNQEDPASLRENDGREEDPEPEEDFQAGDEHHGGVVVFFHEFANGVDHGGGLGSGTAAWRGTGRGLGMESGDYVGAGVGCYVEDGVDHEGEEGEGDLAGEEPDECHCFIQVLISLVACVDVLDNGCHVPRY